jgi:hypothetical protein
MSMEADTALASSQGFSVILEFADRSIATILYTAKGAKALSKEYVEAHAGGRSALLDDFRTLKLMNGRQTDRKSDRSQDKGHLAQLVHLCAVLSGSATVSEPDPLDSMHATLAALSVAQTGRPA